MNIEFNNLKAQWDAVKVDCLNDINSLFEQSHFILGNQVNEFEKKFAEFIGCKYAVGVSNGTDAIKLAAQSLDLKGRILFIIPSNTFVATIFGAEQAYPNADFEMIDCNEYYQLDMDLLEKRLSQVHHNYDNIVVIPVHLYGYTVDIDRLKEVCLKYNSLILEDSSQSHGAEYKGLKTGSFGDVAAFSLYPGKNLGAAGDAGIITTNNIDIYNRLIKLRNLGSSEKYIHTIKGSNHRLDTIQAIILKHKLEFLNQWNQMRRDVVHIFESEINNPLIIKPKTPDNCLPVHHIYPILVENREKFINYLTNKGIQSGIHYPVIISKMEMYLNNFSIDQKAYEFSKKMVSIPIHPFLTQEEIYYICEQINKY